MSRQISDEQWNAMTNLEKASHFSEIGRQWLATYERLPASKATLSIFELVKDAVREAQDQSDYYAKLARTESGS